MKRNALILTITAILATLLTSCQPTWQMDVHENGQLVGSLSPEVILFYRDKLQAEDEDILLAQALYHMGFTLIDHISLSQADGHFTQREWVPIAHLARINMQGEINIRGETFTPTVLDINPTPLSSTIEYSIMDIAPTLAHVLGLPALPEAQGQVRHQAKTKHAVMILIDGLQYQKLINLIEQGELPFFSQFGEIPQGLTVYPPITPASTAALLTGAPPHLNGVYGYGFRSTEMKTLFDLAVENNLSVTAVEGYGLSFNLRNANVILSGDRDGDGRTDDNVLTNSLEIIQAEMPDVLFIHFHDVDDLGHSFGPDSAEYEAAIIQVDDYLSQIYQALPSNTVIAILADHGMQKDTETNGGNHGQLTPSAMIIPIIFLEK
jgi:hypothetical protein